MKITTFLGILGSTVCLVIAGMTGAYLGLEFLATEISEMQTQIAEIEMHEKLRIEEMRAEFNRGWDKDRQLQMNKALTAFEKRQQRQAYEEFVFRKNPTHVPVKYIQEDFGKIPLDRKINDPTLGQLNLGEMLRVLDRFLMRDMEMLTRKTGQTPAEVRSYWQYHTARRYYYGYTIEQYAAYMDVPADMMLLNKGHLTSPFKMKEFARPFYPDKCHGRRVPGM